MKSKEQPQDLTTVVRVMVDSNLSRCRELASWLSPAEGFTIFWCSGPSQQIWSECQRIAPCVLLAGRTLLAEIMPSESAKLPFNEQVRVLVVGLEESQRVEEDVLSKGGAGYLPEASSPSLLRNAVRAVARGELWASREVTSRVVEKLLQQSRSDGLTAREQEILRLIGEGLTNQKIADRLFITRETVRWHIRSAYSKLGVGDRLSAAVYAKQFLLDK